MERVTGFFDNNIMMMGGKMTRLEDWQEVASLAIGELKRVEKDLQSLQKERDEEGRRVNLDQLRSLVEYLELSAKVQMAEEEVTAAKMLLLEIVRALLGEVGLEEAVEVSIKLEG